MNRTSLSFRATWRTRSRSLDTPSPALRPGRVSLAVFPSGRPLPSTTSAPGRPGLFGSFAGSTGLSDFPWSCIKGLPPQRSPHGPTSARSATPRTIQDGASSTTSGRPRDLPVLAHGARRTCLGSPTAQGPPAARDNATGSVAFRLVEQRRHPELLVFRGSIAPPARPLSTLRCALAERQRMTRGHRGRYSFDVEHSHLLLHAGLSRRFPTTTRSTGSPRRPESASARSRSWLT